MTTKVWCAISWKPRRYRISSSAFRSAVFLLATSFILLSENNKNPYAIRRIIIENFVRNYSSIYIGPEHYAAMIEKVHAIMKTGIKTRDAFHIVCAQIAGCSYFLSTDDRLLKYQSEDMRIVNPVDFVCMEIERQ